MKRLAGIALASWLATAPVAAATCTASSGTQRVSLLELYTSEGCSSCPPADRWISALPAFDLGASRVVALAYHVDYWNDLGWKDPFAQGRYTERQRYANARIGNRVIYTPQFMLGGQDYLEWRLRGDLQQRVTVANRDVAGAGITLSLDGSESAAAVAARVTAHRADARLFIALYEDNLSGEVTAGENRGRRLEHDFVVRELAGPFAITRTTIRHSFGLERHWKAHDLSVAAFVQAGTDGEVLQALVLPWCS
jgi:hypothetical protein